MGRAQDRGVPAKVPNENSPLAQMHGLIERAGEEALPPDIVKILDAPFDDSIVDIKPNGAVFVSHVFYRYRLDAAFGVGAWSLVPLASPKTQGDRVVWWGFLKAGGRYIGSAVGGCTYRVSNSEMNWDDAAEGAKSDCLVRCCKELPMFRDLWVKDYGDYFKATYCETYRTNNTKSGFAWRKKKEFREEANPYFRRLKEVPQLPLTTTPDGDDLPDFADDGREGD